MARVVARRQPVIPDLFDWLEAPWSSLLPFSQGQSQTFRVEDYLEDDHYVVRAELPGVDPEQDVEVTVGEGTLTIQAERREEHKEPHRSEFRYGTLIRTLSLPERADTEHVTANYKKGILEVSVPVSQAGPQSRRIEISRAD